MNLLLRLYPRAWRHRYGAELEEVVAAQPWSWQLALDLLGGAIDAHMKPQELARRFEGRASVDEGGRDMVRRLKGCGGEPEMSRKEALGAAGIGLLSALAIAGFLMVNRSQLAETIALCMSPAILVIPTQWFYLRGHSKVVKVMLLGAPLAICFAIGLLAGIAVGD